MFCFGSILLLIRCRTSQHTTIEFDDFDQAELIEDMDGDGFFSDEDGDDGKGNVYPYNLYSSTSALNTKQVRFLHSLNLLIV